MLLRDHGQVKVMKTQGYNCIAVDSDLALLRRGYEKLIKEFKQ